MFLLLDDTDFNRLGFKTGLRRQIKAIQTSLQHESGSSANEANKFNFIVCNQDDAAPQLPDRNENDETISLENKFDIDLLFNLTPEGRMAMEHLKENQPITTNLLGKVTEVICDYLIERVGYHPDAHYKNNIAISLIEKYPALSSKSAALPQALFFYPHAKGTGKHGGRMQWRIEHLVKKHNQRKVNRSKPTVSTTANELASSEGSAEEMADIEETASQLRFMEPCEGSVNIIKQGWIKTITIRNSIRQMDDPEAKISEMFKRFPILGAFDGNLINLDFNHLFPGSADAANRWNDIQHKILQCFKHHASIENEFIRAVVFVKENNPTRGVKRTHDGSKEIRTTLDRIVEWISVRK